MGATTSSAAVTHVAPLTFRNILLPTDFSPCSDSALRVAIQIAKRYGAALFVTHVIPEEPRYELPLEPEPDETNARKSDAERHLDALLATGVLSEVVHEPILRCGEFWENMQDVIASRAIDLIVTGTHGRQGFQKLVLGSVAEKIFRLAACPVMTVGPHAKFPEKAIGNILFATDFSAPSLAAFPYAYSFAERECARLTLQQWIDAYPPLPAQPEIVVASGPVKIVLEVAAQRNTSLIVMGVRHKSSIATHFPWSIADAIVCEASCPVLTVRGS